MIGNLSESSARYQLSAKKKELGDAYADENRAKWNQIADSIDKLRETYESLQPKPAYGLDPSVGNKICMYKPEAGRKRTCHRVHPTTGECLHWGGLC